MKVKFNRPTLVRGEHHAAGSIADLDKDTAYQVTSIGKARELTKQELKELANEDAGPRPVKARPA